MSKMGKYVFIDDEFYERINDNSYTRYDWSDHIDIDDLKKIIEGLPTIEVVRCKECKYGVMTTEGQLKYCKERDPHCTDKLYYSGDNFCSWGEQR